LEVEPITPETNMKGINVNYKYDFFGLHLPNWNVSLLPGMANFKRRVTISTNNHRWAFIDSTGIQDETYLLLQLIYRLDPANVGGQ